MDKSGKPPDSGPRRRYISAYLDEETLKRIDDYRWDKRFPSRMEAIRDVIRIGLQKIECQRRKNKH